MCTGKTLDNIMSLQTYSYLFQFCNNIFESFSSYKVQSDCCYHTFMLYYVLYSIFAAFQCLRFCKVSSQTHQLRLTISNVHASIDTIIIASVFHGGQFFAFFAVNQHPRKFNPQIIIRTRLLIIICGLNFRRCWLTAKNVLLGVRYKRQLFARRSSTMATSLCGRQLI